MRLSEKTIELNICSQWALHKFGPCCGWPYPLWFGLTQRQEARAGFDVCTRMGGRLVLLQFKASNRIVGGHRRFTASHAQLQALQARLRGRRRAVFYVLPTLGTTAELVKSRWLLGQTWLLDVAALPPLPAPTTRSGALRKSGHHYIDLVIKGGTVRAIFRSDPTEVDVVRLSDFLEAARQDNEEFGMELDTEAEFLDICRLLSPRACALVLARLVSS